MCFALKRGEIGRRLDARYHLPVYRLRLLRLLEQYPDVRRLDNYANVFCGPFGTEITSADYQEAGVPMLRISNITKEGTINKNDLVFLTEEKAASLASTQVVPGDLVISQRGTLGMPAVVPDDFPFWNVSANLVAINGLSEISADFVQLYLSSSVGGSQVERCQSGQVQGKITTEDVASVLIPKVEDESNLIAAMGVARGARQDTLARADALLSRMDAYLLEQLSLVVPAEDGRQTYAVRLADMLADRKVNADFFHPERLIAIREQKARTGLRAERLSDIADFIRGGVAADASQDYVGLASVQSNTGELVLTNEEVGGQCFTFQKDDVLFARLRPYLNKVHRAESGGLCSPEFHVIRLRPAKTGAEAVLPDYLATVLRSSLILAQTRHMMTGNTHPRLANEDVTNLVVSIPKPAVQQTIVEELRRRRQDARRLRLQAEKDWAAAKAQFERRLLGGDV